MTDSLVTAEAYYQQHADKEREYVRVYVARPAKEGDSMVVYSGGMGFQSSIDEDGYKLTAYSDIQKGTETFLSADDFKEKTSDASKLTLSQPREELSAEDLGKMTPVKKGKRYVTAGFPIMTNTECDGFLFKDSPSDNGSAFFSNYGLTTAFNYAGKKFESQEELVVSLKDEAPLKGFILDEDVTFAFKAGPYEAKKGSFLYVNPADEDGYTAHPPGFAAFGLRRNLSDEQIAAISDVSLGHAVQVKGPMKFKKSP